MYLFLAAAANDCGMTLRRWTLLKYSKDHQGYMMRVQGGRQIPHQQFTGRFVCRWSYTPQVLVWTDSSRH